MEGVYAFVLILAQFQLCSAKYYVPTESKEIPCREPECQVQITPEELTYTFNDNGLHQMAFIYKDTDKILKLDFDFTLPPTGEASYELKFEQDFKNTLKIKKGADTKYDIMFDEVKLCDVEAKFVLTIDFDQKTAKCDGFITTATLTGELKNTVWKGDEKVADLWISFKVNPGIVSKIKFQKSQILYSEDFRPAFTTSNAETTTVTEMTSTMEMTTNSEAVTTEIKSTEKSFDATFPVYAYVIIAGSIFFFVIVVVVLNLIFQKF